MSLSLASVIDDLATGTYTVTRPGPGSYVNGVWAASGSPSVFPIVASVQPASGKQLMKLTEAQRTEDIRSITTATELKPRTEFNAGDQVAIEGEVFEVFACQPWADDEEQLWKAMASRRGAL